MCRQFCVCACCSCVRFLPPSSETFVQVLDPEVDAEAIAEKAKGDKLKCGRPVDLVTWQMAWDRFALAAAMTKMISFKEAGRYKQASAMHSACCCTPRHLVCVMQVVLDIAIGAAAEARPTSLAVVYDELLRKEVENKCAQLSKKLDFSHMLTHQNENILLQARRFAVLEDIPLLCGRQSR